MTRLVNYGIYLAIILGLIFPAGENVKNLIPILLAIILFFSFLKIKLKIKHFFRKELLYFAIIGLVIVPTIIFFITKNLEAELSPGL